CLSSFSRPLCTCSYTYYIFCSFVFPFFFFCSRPLPSLHSFPTRRSSDLDYCARSFNNPRFTDIIHSLALLQLPIYYIAIRIHNLDRKSTRLNSSHVSISYAVFCLKKKNQQK